VGERHDDQPTKKRASFTGWIAPACSVHQGQFTFSPSFFLLSLHLLSILPGLSFFLSLSIRLFPSILTFIQRRNRSPDFGFLYQG
jgi:hypothetical protein